MLALDIRGTLRARHLAPQGEILAEHIRGTRITVEDRAAFVEGAVDLIEAVRAHDNPGLMEVFLAEYGLSTDEGVALMCLAEALLRVPDDATIDDLIEDKIAPSAWGEHLGRSSSSLVNASTWALMLTGKVLDDAHATGIAKVLHGAVKRLGEPVIRASVKRAMQEMGRQFVLGETIEPAMHRASAQEKDGFTYSYDMLGEAALTEKDALTFFDAYHNAIAAIARAAKSEDIRDNPGISIKLSALHPRYEFKQRDRVMAELVQRALDLALAAKAARIGLNIDAEEADRLDLSLDVIEAILSDGRLAGWDGFGVVVQAYGKRAAPVIDWLYQLAERLDRKIMVRLVKGAYWDTEIKRAQVEGLADFPVFTDKAATDVSYICCAEKLLGLTDRIYPQFATHNAHSVAAILAMASDVDGFEFQRLHGMGEVLHRTVMDRHGSRCRIYAPVGAHRDLLAYLVRRLLENGANSSFVNQIVDEAVTPREIAADPFERFQSLAGRTNDPVCHPSQLFKPQRLNSQGYDLQNIDDVATIDAARDAFRQTQWMAGSSPDGHDPNREQEIIRNPANPDDVVGTVSVATTDDVAAALNTATSWEDTSADARATVLERAADLYEQNFGAFFALLCREAGKTPLDAISELREAVDFLRYYAVQGRFLENRAPRGLFTCISPWNFPLAIFTGQIAAALAAGNGVLAKPAEATPLVATEAVRLLHEAGVPATVLQLLPGTGGEVGQALVSDPRIKGVCFTGSTATAQVINLTMAEHLDPTAPLIAETGGINAMVVDSTALPEQAVRDITISAFQSAGQRCSALRVLYLQKDIADAFEDMLFDAMDELTLGDPWDIATDSGPVIDARAQNGIREHIENARAEGRVLKELTAPEHGFFVPPTAIRVSGIGALDREIFGPVLHIAHFRLEEIDQVIDAINGSGYGLTFGLHTRIDDRVDHLTSRLTVGNMYINRNQIGAIVGSQPFGGEGLSGTGPKAGGPHYVERFCKDANPDLSGATARFHTQDNASKLASFETVQAAIEGLTRPQQTPLDAQILLGPTGESNQLTRHPRGKILCLGPSVDDAIAQRNIALQAGCSPLLVVPDLNGEDGIDGFLKRSDLSSLQGFDGVALWSDNADDLRAVRLALAARSGALLPLMAVQDMASRCVLERHMCIDTTAAGGNASLLASAS